AVLIGCILTSSSPSARPTSLHTVPSPSPSLIRRTTISTLFPYTTLFRSKNMGHEGTLTSSAVMLTTLLSAFTLTGWLFLLRSMRSEEHTSELQSRFDLVCRLLLEKKKNKTTADYHVPVIERHPRYQPLAG